MEFGTVTQFGPPDCSNSYNFQISNIKDGGGCHLEKVKNHHTSAMVFGRTFVKRFALCYWTVVLSVTLVYSGQTVGWIKIKLGMRVGLGHIVLDGDPAPPTERSTAGPHFQNLRAHPY